MYVLGKMLLVVLASGMLTLNVGVKDEYSEFKLQFNDIYSKIANSVEITETKQSLEDIKSDENKNRIKQLEELIENIHDKVPMNKQDEYNLYIKWYNDLVLLRDTSYDDWDDLTFEQQSNIWGAIGVLSVSKEE